MTTKHFKVLLAAAALLCLVASAPQAAPSASPSKHDAAIEDLLRAGQTGRRRVIVRALPGQGEALADRFKQLPDADVRGHHHFIDAVTIEIPLAAVQAVERWPFVASVSLDAPVKTNQLGGGGTAYPLRPTLGLDRYSPQGDGVTVAVIDSGIYPSADFGTRIKAFYDFTRGGIATAPYDDYGHGTHVAGLIGGSGALSNGAYAGIAPKVNLIGLKVLNADGAGATSNVIAALEFATAQKAALGIDVINMSLGHVILESATTDPLVLAVQKATQAGIVVVVSAGNNGVNPATGLPGYGGILSPGNAPAALTVGSINLGGTTKRSDDVVNNFSSRGPTWIDAYAKPDIVAPGYRLNAPAAPGSSLATTYPQFLVAGSSGLPTYMTLSGTSMAAGVASGVVAIAIETNRNAFFTPRPPLAPNALKAILEYTAVGMKDPVTGAKLTALVQGAGGLNAHGVIELSKSIDTGSQKGMTWLARAVATTSTLDEVIVWTQNLLWGNSILWGDAIYVNLDAWDAGILWGDGVLWGDGILWGDNVLWGEGILWGDCLVFGNSILEAMSAPLDDPAYANSISGLNDDAPNR